MLSNKEEKNTFSKKTILRITEQEKSVLTTFLPLCAFYLRLPVLIFPRTHLLRQTLVLILFQEEIEDTKGVIRIRKS